MRVTIALDSAAAEAPRRDDRRRHDHDGSAHDVLTVPAAALRGTAGNYSVPVLDGTTGTPEARPVQVGLVTSSLAEITAASPQASRRHRHEAASSERRPRPTNGGRRRFRVFGGGGVGGGRFNGGGNGTRGGG